MSDPSGVPSVEELLVRLAERDALIVVLTAKVETLTARVVELEARLGKNQPELVETAVHGRLRQATAALAASPVGS